MSNPVALIFRFILKLIFGLSAAVLAVGLLLAALVWVAFSLLKSLVTGRKSTPAVAFALFRQFSRGRTWPGERAFPEKSKAASHEIVDVEAYEIKDTGRPR